jgi:hypothetical protein
MRMQEVRYKCSDYLSISPPVDATCRFKVAEWAYQLVDAFNFRRETVAISLSILDFYLSTEAGRPALYDRKVFQLAATTCMYTAIKIHESPVFMTPELILSELNEENVTEEQVTEMELKILNVIEWRMHPPTAHSFLRHFMEIISDGNLTAIDKDSVHQHAEYAIQLAVYEYSLVAIDASTVALAALMNALEICNACEGSMAIIVMISNESGIDIQSSMVVGSKNKLSQIVTGVSSTGPTEGNLNTNSPVVSKPMLSRRTDLHVSDASSDGQPHAKTDTHDYSPSPPSPVIVRQPFSPSSFLSP